MSISKELEREFKQYIDKIKNKCIKILEEEIQKNVYDKYEPKEYERTMQLLNNVRADIKDNTLYVYINTGNMEYHSAVDGRWVTPLVPYVVNYGHLREIENPIKMYDAYPPRLFIEKAAYRIEKELGIEVEIMNDPPQIV